MPPRPTTSTGPTLGATPSSSSSRSARTWCVAIVLVGVQLLVLRGLTGGLDVNVHDEAHYWRQARLLVAGDFAAFDHAWSLPLVAIHAALLPIGLEPVAQLDAVTIGCMLFSTACLFWCVQRLTDLRVATAATLWWIATSEGLHLERLLGNSYTLGLGLAALTIVLVATGRRWVALPFALLTILNRGEWSLCVAATGLFWLVAALRERRRGGAWADRARPGIAYLALGAATFAALTTSWRARRRSWLTFEQHFEWGHPTGRAAAEVFPGAHSLTSAAAADPGAFLAHLGRNVVRLPGELARTLFDVAPWLPALHWGLIGALAVACVAGLVGRRRNGADVRTARSAATDGSASPWLVVALTPILIVNVVLLPRAPLLTSLVPIALAATFALAARGARGPIAQRIATAIVVGASATVVLAPPFAGQVRTLPHRAAVELLERHATENDVVLGAHVDVLLDYARVDAAEVIDVRALDFAAAHPETDVAALLDDRAVTLVLVTPQFASFPGAARALADLDGDARWRTVAEADGVSLLRREP